MNGNEKIFNIGDEVWVATSGTTTETVTCPECGGKKWHHVIMGNGVEVDVECAECGLGYENPKGYVSRYVWKAAPVQRIVRNVEIGKEGNRYGTEPYYVNDGDDVFETEEEAINKAKELAIEHQKREDEKLTRKEEPNRTWSFNASYHRGCIKKAKRDLEWHTAKLNIAKAKAKEDS